MQHAIRSGSPDMFDVDSYFKYNDIVDWRKSGYIQQVGDIIYIYVSDPIRRIKYKTEVVEVDVPFEDTIDDKDYWVDSEKYEDSKEEYYIKLRLIGYGDTEELSYDNLLQKGFVQGIIRGKIIMSEDFVQYVDKFLKDVQIDETDNHFGDELKESDAHKFPEGAVKKIKVNTYERNSHARRKCIEYHGVNCSICGLNFEEMYGEMGKGYIHVHHIVPLSEIGEGYEVDPINDLIPVCPNCHNMLHKKTNGKYLSIDELKEIIESNKK